MSAVASAAGRTRRGRRPRAGTCSPWSPSDAGSSHEDHGPTTPDGRHPRRPSTTSHPAEPAGVCHPFPVHDRHCRGPAVAALGGGGAPGFSRAGRGTLTELVGYDRYGAQQGYDRCGGQQGYDQYGGHGYVEQFDPMQDPRRPLRARHNLRAGPAWASSGERRSREPSPAATPVVRTCELRCSGSKHLH